MDIIINHTINMLIIMKNTVNNRKILIRLIISKKKKKKLGEMLPTQLVSHQYTI
jgi:hypothetical protein